MTEKAQITVLIVDDHAIVRKGVSAFFAVQPDCQVVGEAETGAEAVRLAAEFVPDIILMDLALPDFDGVEATRRVKHVSPHSIIIVLTSFHDDAHIFPALRAGASSYILKDINPDELVEAVRKTAHGESILHPRVAARVVQEVSGTRGTAPNPFLELSQRELEVLRLIAAGRSNREISDQLMISEKTVKGHLSNILSKLHLLDRTQAAIFAWQQGLIHRE